MDDEAWAELMGEAEMGGEPEPAVANPTAEQSPALGTQTPPVAPAPAESGTAPAVAQQTAPAVIEAAPLAPDAITREQLEAQLAEVTAARNALQQNVDSEKAAADAAKAAREAAVLAEELKRENGVAKSLYQGFVDEGEPKKAQAFAWMHDRMTKRINESVAKIEQQTYAINAYVYVTQVFAPEQFANIIEIGDSVSHLSGDEMIAAVNSIVESQLNAREGSLEKDKTIEELRSEIATLKAQSTDPRAHLVEGGPSQPGQKPESEWDFEDHWNYARGAPVGVGTS